jgi:hypothetical protein
MLGFGRSFCAGLEVEVCVEGVEFDLVGEVVKAEEDAELVSSVDSPPILDRSEATGASSFFSPRCQRMSIATK